MEHGLFDHGNSLYRFAIEVPLFMTGGGLPAATRVSRPDSLREIPATVMDLAGGTQRFQGKSLRTAWSGSPDSSAVISETSGPSPRRWFKSVIANGRHAIWSADSILLFDFPDDSLELRNLITRGQPDPALDSLAGIFERETGQRP
jgi:arylsulfatase A-like enzyme